MARLLPRDQQTAGRVSDTHPDPFAEIQRRRELRTRTVEYVRDDIGQQRPAVVGNVAVAHARWIDRDHGVPSGREMAGHAVALDREVEVARCHSATRYAPEHGSVAGRALRRAEHSHRDFLHNRERGMTHTNPPRVAHEHRSVNRG